MAPTGILLLTGTGFLFFYPSLTRTCYKEFLFFHNQILAAFRVRYTAMKEFVMCVFFFFKIDPVSSGCGGAGAQAEGRREKRRGRSPARQLRHGQ